VFNPLMCFYLNQKSSCIIINQNHDDDVCYDYDIIVIMKGVLYNFANTRFFWPNYTWHCFR